MKARIDISETDGRDSSVRTLNLELPDPRTMEHRQGPRDVVVDVADWTEVRHLLTLSITQLTRIRPDIMSVKIDLHFA